MYSDKPEFTRLTLEKNNLKVTWEVPYSDVDGNDMMQAIRTIMIGMTFSDKTVASSMGSFLENYYEYTVIDHENDPDLQNSLYEV